MLKMNPTVVNFECNEYCFVKMEIETKNQYSTSATFVDFTISNVIFNKKSGKFHNNCVKRRHFL